MRIEPAAPKTRTVREYSPEEIFSGRVPEGYVALARSIAEDVVSDPVKLREFFVNGHRYSQPVRAEVANVIADGGRSEPPSGP